MSDPAFVHLVIHTEYSLVDGLVRIRPLIDAALASGQPTLAVTDQNNLFAAIKFYKASLGAGIKPLIGADLRLSPQESGGVPSVLRLYCQDSRGYRNLCELIARAYQEGQQGDQPLLDRRWLAGHSEGLIALSGGRLGEIGQAVAAGRVERAESLAREWAAWFPGRFYLELVRTQRDGEEAWIAAAVELATRLDLPVVATNDVRFLEAGDFDAHEARVCIHDGRVLADKHRPRHYSSEQYLKTPAQMATLFADLPEALRNSVEIAKRCNLEIGLGTYYLPEFEIPAGLTMDEFFRREAERGLEARLDQLFDRQAADFADRRQVYDQRLRVELDVIIQMGFPGYFLIVADFIQWSKANGVPVGPGRGSGAGSLVAYALTITDLDPIAYDLLFERFLNPERVSMPDFDIDFCMEGRDRVIDYVARKYGRDRVSQIITYGSMAAKAVVRDVGRVLGHPYGFCDRIAKLIPFELGMTLEKALAQEEQLRQLYEEEEEVTFLIDLAMKLEGLARNAGKHAGGVVIAPSKLTDFAPLYCEPGGGGLVTQYDKNDIEEVGLVKFDFLGLRTLTIIDWALRHIHAAQDAAGEARLDINSIPLDDPDTFELLKKYQTTAVFQLESSGMKDLIRRLQPDSFEDIIALVALFRPGPLQSGMVDDFIARKHGKQKIVYDHPDLEPVLAPTYGVILYQEQVQRIAQVLAGYSLGGADLLRRAMGKKKPEEMAKQRAIFTGGALKNGIEEGVATHIFDLMEKFAGYGFNKSHSAAYALVSYQTAWLKRHYPAAFMAAVLSADMDNTDKVVTLIDECRALALKVVPPSVNRSAYRFTIEGSDTVVYGLGAIKGVGEAALEGVIAEREAAGPYLDLYDFCRRIEPGRVNRRVLEALIRAGALDGLGPNRASMMAALPTALALAERHAQQTASGQDDLFGDPVLSQDDAEQGPIATIEDWPDDERLTAEKETLGLYLTGHPIRRHLPELQRFTSDRLVRLLAESPPAGGARGRGRSVVAAGLLVALRVRNTRRGKMAFITLDDESARIEARIFSEVFDRYQSLLQKDALLVLQGELAFDDYNGQMALTVEEVMDLTAARCRWARRLLIGIDQAQAVNGMVDRLSEVLQPYREAGEGNGCPVVLDYRNPQARAQLRLGEAWRVAPSEELLARLQRLGAEEVRLVYNESDG